MAVINWKFESKIIGLRKKVVEILFRYIVNDLATLVKL